MEDSFTNKVPVLLVVVRLAKKRYRLLPWESSQPASLELFANNSEDETDESRFDTR